jgi:hypothetical protein
VSHWQDLENCDSGVVLIREDTRCKDEENFQITAPVYVGFCAGSITNLGNDALRWQTAISCRNAWLRFSGCVAVKASRETTYRTHPHGFTS